MVVYRPPKYNKDFVNYFADLLTKYITKYDCVLIVGNFYIYVCCPDMPMGKTFLSLIDSFNFGQYVTGPNMDTLDLVLSYSFPVFNIEICEPVFLS